MKPAPFRYEAPRTLDECLELLQELGTDATVLAGGQSLVPQLRFRTRQPANIVSISRLDIATEPHATQPQAGAPSWLSIGPKVTFARVASASTVARLCPFLRDTIALVGNPAVRSRGTLCGNLAHADPASEVPALAVALGARLRLRSTAGERVVPAESFFLGPHRTDIASGEMVVAVEFPEQPPTGTSIQEIGRSRFGLPVAGVVVSVFAPAGRLEDVRIGCFGVGPTPVRGTAAEAILLDAGIADDTVDAAVLALAETLEPVGDWLASTDYRRAAVAAMLRRAVNEASAAAALAA